MVGTDRKLTMGVGAAMSVGAAVSVSVSVSVSVDVAVAGPLASTVLVVAFVRVPAMDMAGVATEQPAASQQAQGRGQQRRKSEAASKRALLGCQHHAVQV